MTHTKHATDSKQKAPTDEQGSTTQPVSDVVIAPIPWLYLLASVGTVFVLRFWVSYAQPNIGWPDEMFQYLEPAHRLVYGYGIIPADFYIGLRSWLIPGLLTIPMYLLSLLGIEDGGYVIAIPLFLCFISVVPFFFSMLWGFRIGGVSCLLSVAFVCGVWSDFFYMAAKPLSSILATHFLFSGLFLGGSAKEDANYKKLFWASLLCGFALTLRIQLAPIVLFSLCYFVWKSVQVSWKQVALGAAIPILFAGTLDYFTWGGFFWSYRLYLWQHLVEGSYAHQGGFAWYMYFVMFAKTWGWWSIPVLLLMLLGARKQPFLFWVALLHFGCHLFVTQKKFRFLYPSVFIGIFLAGLGVHQLFIWLREFPLTLAFQRLAIVVVLFVWALGSFTISTYENYDDPIWLRRSSGIARWSSFRGSVEGFRMMNRDKDACGVGLLGVHWSVTGGYYYLHKEIPIFELKSKRSYRAYYPHFNYLIVSRHLQLKKPRGFDIVGCWNEFCLLKRPGTCDERKEYHINDELRKRFFRK